MLTNGTVARMFVKIICVPFVFEEDKVKILFIKEDEDNKEGKKVLPYSLMCEYEAPEDTAKRVVNGLTGFTVMTNTGFNLIDIIKGKQDDTAVIYFFCFLKPVKRYSTLVSNFSCKLPQGHKQKGEKQDEVIIQKAISIIRLNANNLPWLLNILPEKFTMKQLFALYESVYECRFDQRNFYRKLFSTGLLIKTMEKEKTTSRKGSFLYSLQSGGD